MTAIQENDQHENKSQEVLAAWAFAVFLGKGAEAPMSLPQLNGVELLLGGRGGGLGGSSFGLSGLGCFGSNKFRQRARLSETCVRVQYRWKRTASIF